jgi:1,2-dihydroxy-3-keto-5-methylthiopentene dioxygenase
MSQLTVFHDNNPATPILHTDNASEIASALQKEGVRFEQWQANSPIKAGDSAEVVIEAFSNDIARIKKEGGYITVDVISLNSSNPQKDELRKKFLNEHIHTEDEVRFFVAGRGLFTLHIKDKVYEVLCEKNDLISVPANTTHWFDMGPNPDFVAIRFFNNPEGWVAQFTGSDIAEKFSRLND